jgi:hypothetical protein
LRRLIEAVVCSRLCGAIWERKCRKRRSEVVSSLAERGKFVVRVFVRE